MNKQNHLRMPGFVAPLFKLVVRKYPILLSRIFFVCFVKRRLHKTCVLYKIFVRHERQPQITKQFPKKKKISNTLFKNFFCVFCVKEFTQNVCFV